MRNGKKLTALILTAAVLICVPASCGKTPGDSGLIIEYEDFSYVPPKTVAPDYVIAENPLDISFSGVDSGYIIISGLNDRTAQERVNQAIREEYARLSDPAFLPPVTGIRVLEKKYEGQPSESGVWCSESCNAENILSVTFSYWKRYGQPDETAPRPYKADTISYETHMSFDLSTGKKLKLSDLFIDGVDPVRYINAAIIRMVSGSDNSSETLYEDSMDQGLRLTGAFKGIRDDQPFYITSDGDLVICFDERNTEFALEPSQTARIDIRTVSAIPSKFGSKSGVFEKRVSSRVIASRKFPQGSMSAVDIPGTQRISVYRGGEDDPSARVYFWSGVHNYAGLPDEVNKYLSLGWLGTPRLVSEAKGRATALLAEDESVYGSFYVYSNAELVGEYINTSAGYEEHYYSWDLDKELYADEYCQLACYKEGSGTPLKIEDLFWKSERAEELMRDAQIEAFKQYKYAYYKNNYNTLGRLAEELTEHISGFNVSNFALMLQYDTDVNKLIAKHFPGASKEYRQRLYAVIGSLDYNWIGTENLRIFK